ncbi:hypothetical protein HKW98_09120 [Stutzerimonas urumqiensis]|uniref:hypothetical protein n=1 Tax=Stutzerimonas urumqiensis TaxID=638269 RepID=UPI003BAC866C
MRNDITVQITLNTQQAEAFLRWLASQYQVLMTECWYADRYRHTPSGFRAPLILQDHPHVAGVSRTARELKKQLTAGETAR